MRLKEVALQCSNLVLIPLSGVKLSQKKTYGLFRKRKNSVLKSVSYTHLVPKIWNPPSEEYRELLSIPFIRQLMIQPPLLLDPPMNKRTGHFQKVTQNLLSNIMIDEKKWLCYPAQVGKLVIFIYFEEGFMGLGCSLANLFELADDDQIKDCLLYTSRCV